MANEIDAVAANGYFYPLNKLNKIMPKPENLPYPIEPAPPGWCSANMLVKQGFVGGNVKINQSIVELAERLSREEKLTAEIADYWVRVCLAANGRTAWFVSPIGQQRLRSDGKLLTKKEFEQLKAPANWNSIRMLTNQFVADADRLFADVLAVKERLAKKGRSQKLIDAEWIRHCPNANGQPTLFVSPKMLKYLRFAGRLHTAAEVETLKAPPGWCSGSMLAQQFVGNHQKIHKMILALKDRLKKKGKTAKQIADHWARFYVPDNYGMRLLFASPKAQRYLRLTKKILTSTEFKSSMAPLNWQSATTLSKQFVGGDIKINRLILKLKENLEKEGLNQQNIADIWLRYCLAKNGSSAWFISPLGLNRIRSTGELLTAEELNTLKAPLSWSSGNMLALKFKGTSEKFNDLILALKDQLTKEGRTPEEIADNLVRYCIAGNSYQRAWFLSPEAEERLVKDYNLQRKPPQENQDRAICSLLAAGMDAPAIGIALKIGKTGTEKRIAAIRAAIAKGESVALAEYQAEIAHNRTIDRETFLAAVRDTDSIEITAERLGLSPKRVMARLGRYMRFDQSLFDTLDSPGVNFDLAASTDFTHLPKTSIYATWLVVRNYHQQQHTAPDLNQLATILGVGRKVVDKNVTFLITADMLRREQLAQDDSASSAGASPTTAMAIRLHHGMGR